MPTPMPRLTENDKNSFWSKVDIRSENECWNWKLSKRHYGHGKVKIQGKNYQASRIAWYISNRSDPGNLFVCHHCDNGTCCNPKHLFLGTNSDNIKDAVRKGRHVDNSGENHGMSKLTNTDILKIKLLASLGYTQSELSKRFKVHQSCISRVLSKKRWKHLG